MCLRSLVLAGLLLWFPGGVCTLLDGLGSVDIWTVSVWIALWILNVVNEGIVKFFYIRKIIISSHMNNMPHSNG